MEPEELGDLLEPHSSMQLFQLTLNLISPVFQSKTFDKNLFPAHTDTRCEAEYRSNYNYNYYSNYNYSKYNYNYNCSKYNYNYYYSSNYYYYTNPHCSFHKPNDSANHHNSNYNHYTNHYNPRHLGFNQSKRNNLGSRTSLSMEAQNSSQRRIEGKITKCFTSQTGRLEEAKILQMGPPVPSCVEGAYLPTFVSPTPENRAQLYTPAGQALVINIRAEATQSNYTNTFLHSNLRCVIVTVGNAHIIALNMMISTTLSMEDDSDAILALIKKTLVNEGLPSTISLRLLSSGKVVVTTPSP
ncbi:hypothetical protein CCH79_00018538 [Gambusia affinis]|uniref:Uncharacterized protein n=1 Tax=Gambusia affinis TaxID=33528 RepID=A0A315UN82_GAMAF|nr:hypothetical protein CCH79_00018538 [Gambusia affinis]